MATCQACGRDIADDMMFCPYCGTRRPVDASGRPEEVTEERMLGVIPDARYFSERRGEGRYTVVVTDRRLLFAKMTEQDIGSMRPSRWLGGLAAMRTDAPDGGSGAAYADRYNEMTATEVLAESSENFFVRERDVASILLSSEDQGGSYGLSFTSDVEPFRLVIRAQHDHRDLLMAVFGGRFHW